MRAGTSHGVVFGAALLLAVLSLPCAGAGFVSTATGISYQHGIAYLREPGYPVDFSHFHYVDPDAPYLVLS